MHERARCSGGCVSRKNCSGRRVACDLLLSAVRRTPVNGSKCDCLGPPVRVGALSEERVDERVIEFARLYQVATKLRDRLTPVIGPLGATVIDRRLRGAFNFLETIGSEPRR